MIYIPEEILKIIGQENYEENDVGMSESTVLMYSDYVLKIQHKSPETENEVQIINWLEGRLPCPRIIKYIEENDISYTLMSRINGDMLCDRKYLTNPETLMDILAEGLKKLWSLDIKDCPCVTVTPIKERLKAARYNVEHGFVDVAIALRSLKHNFEGRYSDGEVFLKFEPSMFLGRLGLPMDEKKNRYFLLLDELF